MRAVGIVVLVTLMAFVSPALALDDCNQFGNVGQLQQRLECLHKNNQELHTEINALKSAIGSFGDFLKYGSVVELQSKGNARCLTSGGSASHAISCGGDEEKFVLGR
jgi:hypothetical protein